MKFKLFVRRVAKLTSDFVGSSLAFTLALMVVIAWTIYAIPHRFDSDSQMPINSFTSIVTFIMVFLIQNCANRENRALHLKIDELIRSSQANNRFVKLETLPDEIVESIDQEIESNTK